MCAFPWNPGAGSIGRSTGERLRLGKMKWGGCLFSPAEATYLFFFERLWGTAWNNTRAVSTDDMSHAGLELWMEGRDIRRRPEICKVVPNELFLSFLFFFFGFHIHSVLSSDGVHPEAAADYTTWSCWARLSFDRGNGCWLWQITAKRNCPNWNEYHHFSLLVYLISALKY